MRVISGSAGGIPLLCPKSDHVRPTMDQVRAAIFSSLAERVPDARVLDLFAGAGGLGIEALSRGARAATFVERDRRTADCIRENLTRTRLAVHADVVCLDAFLFVQRHAAKAGRTLFDLIFADPPYTSKTQTEDFARKLLASTSLVELLAADGLFVLEKSPRHPLPPDLSGWETIRQKRYGTTEVVFLRRSAAESTDQSVDRQLLS